MTEPRRSREELLKTSISRRQVLQGGLLAGSAAFLAACGASATPSPAPTAPPAATPAPTAPPAATPAPTASAAPATPAASASAAPSATPAASAAAPTPAPTSFAGLTLNGFSGGFSLHAEAIGLAAWKAATGGNATFDNVPFNEKPVKLATIIATQDSSWDTMYTSDNFMALFGARLLIPIEPWFGDLSDFPPSVLNEFTTQSDMVLRGIPNFHDSYYWSHNPTLWAQGGGDPNNIPTVWDDLIALAPEFLAKGVKPSVQPWIGTDGGFAVFYFKQMYNSFNVPFLNADRTQVAFGGPEGMAVFTTIANGLKNGYWDNTTLNIGNEHDAFTLFAQGKYACLVDGTDNPKTGLNSSNYIVGVMPGMKAGSTGSVNGDDGLGINKFSPNQAASMSFMQTMYSIPVAQQIAVATPEIYGSPRISLQTYPPLVAIETNPTPQVIAANSAGPSSLWSTPYNYAPVFDDVLSKLIKGTYTSPQEALDAAVKGVQDLIVTYLSA